jgi:hypothetical protein
MLTSIDIVFWRPQNRFPYIIIVEAQLSEKGIMAWMSAYTVYPVPNLFSMISMGIQYSIFIIALVSH